MPLPTPPQLTELLDRLGLATSGQVASVAPAVRRLAGDLPDFESVWVDALVQRRLLTPFQAAKLNAGHGEDLAVGPFVLRAQLWSPAWAETFQAIDRQSGEPAELLVVQTSADDSARVAGELQRLIEGLRLCSDASLLR